jgi:hypothetical protein
MILLLSGLGEAEKTNGQGRKRLDSARWEGRSPWKSDFYRMASSDDLETAAEQ